jgi:hypothetical protein
MEVIQTHKLNLAILATEIAEEIWHNMSWGGAVGHTTVTKQKNGQKDYGSMGANPVSVVRDFVEEGRDNMLLPFLNRFTGSAVFGDTQVKGTGEEQSLRYTRTYINQWRKAAMQMSGRMSNQRVKMYNLPEKVKKQLMMWVAEYINSLITQAFYKGASENLYAGTTEDGLGLDVRYHPNTYIHVTSDGTITAAGTEFYTKTAAEYYAQAYTATSLVATAKMMDEFAVICQLNRFNQVTNKDGEDFWLMKVHPRVMKALRADTTILSAQNAAFNGALMKHPSINNRQILYYTGICVVSDLLACRAMDVNYKLASTVTDGYGRACNPWILPQPANAAVTYPCLLVGDGAMAMGMGGDQDLYLTYEVDDHENVKEIAVGQISGVNRVEQFNSTDEALVYVTGNAAETVAPKKYTENTSSAILLCKGA